jgi:hypothetical protein
MRARSDYRSKVQRIADLRIETEELERKLDSVRISLESELAAPARETGAGQVKDAHCRGRRAAGRHHHGDASALFGPPLPGRGAAEYETEEPEDSPDPDDRRTEELLSHGRRSTYHSGQRHHRRMMAIIAAAAAAILALTIVIVALAAGGASWPDSVAAVQAYATRACKNPDVKSEPDQVNFACGTATRQVLWVFALISGDDNPGFADPVTGREGLEPITPAEGGQVAMSLNLHSPYNPLNPVDSLEVAARAINSIIGGATVTASNGSAVVQPGLEADAANCVRYTGSAAVTSRQGFPGLCTRPVITTAGQAALVADVYQRWVVGATPQTAQDAALLFENANNPGNPQVQVILRHLRQLQA